jgi:sterol desaturase/sphingolipid hydroxylase (fatty acid hydroxylase superfamily)
MDVFAGALLLYSLLLAETAYLAFRGRNVPWRDIAADLASGHLPMWLCRGLEIAGFAWIASHAPVHVLDGLPRAVQWAVAFVVWDLSFYWLHRLHHAIPFLWKIHVVHHQGEAYGFSLGIRNAWFSSLTSLPFFVPMALLGFGAELFVAVGSVHYFVQFWNHSALAGKLGVLESVMVTPTHHRVHHGRQREYIDCNFGGTLVLWDKLFGSFRQELPDVPLLYGVEGDAPRSNPIDANLGPFAPASAGFRTSVRLAAHPARDRFVGLAGLILFTLLLQYVREAPHWTWTVRLGWGAIVTMATCALGAYADGRSKAFAIWIVTGPVACLVASVWLDSIWIGLVGLLLASLSAWHAREVAKP